jgi:hypothetical protein
LVRKTVEPPTATLLAISSSLAPASAASKICRALELARGILAAAEKGLEFIAFGLVEFDRLRIFIRASCSLEARTNN